MKSIIRSNYSKKVFSVAGIIIIAICFYYLFQSVLAQWDEVKNITVNIDIALFSLSLFLLAISYVFEAFAWNISLNILHENLPLSKATGIVFLSSLTNYLPVKGAGLASRIVIGKYAGISAQKGLSSAFLESWYSLLATALIIVFLIFRIDFFTVRWFYGVVTTLLWIGLFLLCAKIGPLLSTLSGKLIIKYFKKFNFKIPGVTLQQSVKLLSGFLVPRLLMGVSLWMITVSMSSEGTENLLQIIGVQSLAWICSLIFFFVPKGLGVREVTIVYFLSFYMHPSHAMVAAILFRLTSMLMDFLFALYGIYIGRDILLFHIRKSR